ASAQAASHRARAAGHPARPAPSFGAAGSSAPEEMITEFRKAAMPEDLRRLLAFDRKVFPSDHFPPEYWRECESWWLILGRTRVGCCAFEKLSKRTLYIASTGILPQYRNRGLGKLFKAWQISYATHHGFRRIIAHTRKSNQKMIALNASFGFKA